MRRTTRPFSRSTAAVCAAALLALVPLTGCAIGFDAATRQQRPSGNGANADQGTIAIRGLTLVEGPADSRTGTFVMALVNTGADADALLSARLVDPAGGQAVILGTGTAGGSLPLPARSRTLVGYNSDIHLDVTGLTLSPTQFTLVELAFQKAGRVEVPVMSVLPTGSYEDVAPLP